MMLPDSFSNLPDWSLDPANYPSVYLIDKYWTDDANYSALTGSEVTAPLSGLTPLATDPTEVVYNHGEQTQCVIQYMARNLPNTNIKHVSVVRQFDSQLALRRLYMDLPQALHTIQIQPGDLVVINVGFNNASDSFASDPYVCLLLNNMMKLGAIIVLTAGNTTDSLESSSTTYAIVVGAIDANGNVQSRYGKYVTCYGVTPYNLPGLSGYTVSFDRSSAATAYTAGMVLMMLNYAKSTGRTPTSKQIVDILKNNGTEFKLLADPDSGLGIGILPDWGKLQTAIDNLPR